MPQDSPNLDLPFLQPAQAQKHVTHNEALRRLDLLVQLRLQRTGATTPPAAPDEGDTYALGTTPGGAWAGRAGQLAAWLDGTWHFVAPRTGWTGWNLEQAQPVVWDGDAWIAAMPEMLARLGIGAAADTVNRLTVQAGATLLTHDGTDHRLKVNKAAEGDTASLLFQSGWTGHAEMGLTGQTAFSIKVSADGSTWTEALRLDEATGQASGTAVQADPGDATPGRLMAAGAFGLGQTGQALSIADIDAEDTPGGLWRYGPGTANLTRLPGPLAGATGQIRIEREDAGTLRQTAWSSEVAHGVWTRTLGAGSWSHWQRLMDQSMIVGSVTQQAGLPTGAVIESGSTPDGAYTRFADGTQMCRKAFVSAATDHAWTFPVPFSAGGETVVQALPRNAGAPRIVTEGGDLSDTGVTLQVWDMDGNSAAAALMATATGRWF